VKTYIASRIVQAGILIIIVLGFNFFLFRILPGDPTRAICGDPRVPAETRETLYKMFGLDRPLHEQFLLYLMNVFRGNLGISYQYKISIIPLLIERLRNTLLLLLPATILSITIGITMAIVAVRFRGKWIDKLITSMATLLWSVPSFWGGMLMIYFFAVELRLFPTGGLISFGATSIEMGDLLHHLILPMITYGVIYSGQYALVLRDSLTDVLAEDFILLAKAKGYTDFQVLKKHAFKNASLPLITLIGLNLGYLILGSISIETVFTWPGVGRLVYEAVYFNDYSLLQGIFLFFSIVMISIMVVVDILYTYLDPRVRFKQQWG